MRRTATWATIRKGSTHSPATLTITGYRDGEPPQAVSRGQVSIRTSADPVGAPIFFRDVPLMPSETEKGVIKPLAAAVQQNNTRLAEKLKAAVAAYESRQ